jgi:hypothetical protein
MFYVTNYVTDSMKKLIRVGLPTTLRVHLCLINLAARIQVSLFKEQYSSNVVIMPPLATPQHLNEAFRIARNPRTAVLPVSLLPVRLPFFDSSWCCRKPFGSKIRPFLFTNRKYRNAIKYIICISNCIF